jgi:hypothetical protein
MLRSAFPNKGFPLRVLSASAVIHPTFFHRRDTEFAEVERFFTNHSFLRLLSALRGELSESLMLITSVRSLFDHELWCQPAQKSWLSLYTHLTLPTTERV